MAISIKTSEDIEKMRVAGRLAAEVLEMIEPLSLIHIYWALFHPPPAARRERR